MIELWCDLNGPRMLIPRGGPGASRSSDGDLVEAGNRPGTIGRFHGDDRTRRNLRAPEGVPVRFEGKSVDGLECIVHQSGVDEYFRVDGELGIHLSEFESRITVAPGAERLLASSLGFNAIAGGLHVGGQYCLHAAGSGICR